MSRTQNIETYQHRYLPGELGSLAHDWTLLLLHGTGGNENDLIPLGQALLPGAAILSPRGQVSEGGALRFFRRHAEGVLDMEDLANRSIEMDEWIGAAALEYAFDPAKVIAAGFSNGANLATSMLLRGSTSLRAGVLLSPMLPFTPDPLPDLVGKSVFIGAGKIDPLVPVKQVEALVDIFNLSGATTTLFWTPGGHGITGDEICAAKSWLEPLIYPRTGHAQ
jgi:phospholipase/carboxylesterase